MNSISRVPFPISDPAAAARKALKEAVGYSEVIPDTAPTAKPTTEAIVENFMAKALSGQVEPISSNEIAIGDTPLPGNPVDFLKRLTGIHAETVAGKRYLNDISLFFAKLVETVNGKSIPTDIIERLSSDYKAIQTRHGSFVGDAFIANPAHRGGLTFDQLILAAAVPDAREWVKEISPPAPPPARFSIVKWVKGLFARSPHTENNAGGSPAASLPSHLPAAAPLPPVNSPEKLADAVDRLNGGMNDGPWIPVQEPPPEDIAVGSVTETAPADIADAAPDNIAGQGSNGQNANNAVTDTAVVGVAAEKGSYALRHLKRMIDNEQHWALQRYMEAARTSATPLSADAVELLTAYGKARYEENRTALEKQAKALETQVQEMAASRNAYIERIVGDGVIDKRDTLANLEKFGLISNMLDTAQAAGFKNDPKVEEFINGYHALEAARSEQARLMLAASNGLDADVAATLQTEKTKAEGRFITHKQPEMDLRQLEWKIARKLATPGPQELNRRLAKAENTVSARIGDEGNAPATSSNGSAKRHSGKAAPKRPSPGSGQTPTDPHPIQL